jgi:hypothetical protein
MARFRKKPVVIDAVQYDGEWSTVMHWLDELAGGTFIVPIGKKPPITRDPDTGYLSIETKEGIMQALEGDWVIRGVKGELYPCKPDIFTLTYEAVEE